MARLLALVLAAALPAVAASATTAPVVTGRVFDAYLDVRIALRQEAPALDAQLDTMEDPAPLASRLAPFLERHGLALEQFAQAHGLVFRDAGLQGRVAAILDRHTPASGSGAGAMPGGEPPRPPAPDRR